MTRAASCTRGWGLAIPNISALLQSFAEEVLHHLGAQPRRRLVRLCVASPGPPHRQGRRRIARGRPAARAGSGTGRKAVHARLVCRLEATRQYARLRQGNYSGSMLLRSGISVLAPRSRSATASFLETNLRFPPTTAS